MALVETPLNNSRKPVMTALPESENNGDNEIIFTTISCQSQSRVGVRSQRHGPEGPAQIALAGIPGEYHDNTEIITQIIRHNCTITLHLYTETTKPSPTLSHTEPFANYGIPTKIFILLTCHRAVSAPLPTQHRVCFLDN